METVLVTGAAGFIGSNLVAALLKEGYRVVGVDNFDDTYETHFKEAHLAPFASDKNFVLERVDITDGPAFDAVVQREKPTYLVHLAAKADTRAAVESPDIYVSVNVHGTLNVLESARKAGVKETVVASSSSVYGNDADVPWVETAMADKPISPYGATKRATELLAHSYHHNFGMNIVCLRYFNVYGENNRPGMVPYKWTEALLKGEEIEMSGEGTRRRDYTYVGDTVRATIAAMKSGIGFEIINVGNNKPLSLRELLTLLEGATGKTATVHSRPSHPASVEITYADGEKAKRLLNWEPEMPVEEGFGRLVAWFRDNRLKQGE